MAGTKCWIGLSSCYEWNKIDAFWFYERPRGRIQISADNPVNATIISKHYLNTISVPISIAGVSAGALSGSVASPFYMLKTQQQSLSSIQVGNQHSESNTGMFRFFKSQVEKGGITGKVLHSIKGWKLVWLIYDMRLFDVICPYRIHMPTATPRWRLFSLSLVHIFATGSVVRAYAFYKDGLYPYVQLIQRYIVVPVVKSFVWLLEVEVNLQVLLIQNDS